jgi:hypothetical protein
MMVAIPKGRKTILQFRRFTMANISRRSLLKGGAALVGGVGLASFSELFGFQRLFAQGSGDDAQTILNLAATAETLATTHYYNVLTNSNIALTPAENAILKSALDTELQHLEYLNANGGTALTNSFFFPLNVYTDRDQFSMITEQAETAFVAAYLASVRRIAELGNPLLAATAAQVAVTEQVHLAMIRQIGGRVPNHVSLGQAMFFNTSDAVPVLQGFLEGGNGFMTDARPYPGADAIRDLVRDDGVLPIQPFTDPTLFAAQTASGDATCTVTGRVNVNIRSGPSVDFPIVGTLAPNDTRDVMGQAPDDDGFTWWQVVDGWVRSDVVRIVSGTCDSIPLASM